MLLALLCTKIKWNWSPKPHRLPSVTTLLSCPILTIANVNVAVVDWDAVPGEPVPVMVTVKAFAVVEVHDRLEVPVPLAASDTGVTVNGLQVKPAGRGVSERATEPTKLNVLVRVIVELIDEPAGPLGEVAVIVKSPT